MIEKNFIDNYLYLFRRNMERWVELDYTIVHVKSKSLIEKQWRICLDYIIAQEDIKYELIYCATCYETILNSNILGIDKRGNVYTLWDNTYTREQHTHDKRVLNAMSTFIKKLDILGVYNSSKDNRQYGKPDYNHFSYTIPPKCLIYKHIPNLFKARVEYLVKTIELITVDDIYKEINMNIHNKMYVRRLYKFKRWSHNFRVSKDKMLYMYGNLYVYNSFTSNITFNNTDTRIFKIIN